MNKRQKIIVSIVGITIVLLALLGITYAYYLTRIEGNTNTNSMSITTADLKIEYADGNGIITAKNIMPGDTVGTKTFTVTNKGNTSIDNYGISLDYAEIIKDNKIVLPSIFERPEDFEITLTCKDNNNDDCNGFTGNFNNESIIITTSNIEPNEVHNYSLSIYYANPDIDQSNDMGKNLNLKVNIFSVNESADINGTITGVDSTYALKVNSEPKLSTIVNGKYKLKGLEVGTHTLSIIDNNGNVVKSQKLVVQTGDNPGISEIVVDSETVPLIIINETNRVAPLNTTYDTTTTTITNSGADVETFNPYESNKNTLAYNIINNSINNLNGTQYYDEPLSIPALTINGIKYNKTITEESVSVSSVSSTYSSYYWTYAESYEVDEKNGIILNDVKTCKYSECYSSLEGKYILSESPYYTSYSKNKIYNIEKPLTEIYKITTPATSETSGYTLKKISLSTISFEENILSKKEDDFGTSYYYRGNVVDNYVNFAGMCWRIVRIAGDGSIKLILEDNTYECNSQSYTGNYSIGTGTYGYTVDANSNERTNYLNSSKSGMANAFKNYQTTLETKLKSIDSTKTLKNTLKVGDWCYDDNVYSDIYGTNKIDDIDYYYENEKDFYYGAFARVKGRKETSLKCEGSVYEKFGDNSTDMYIASLTYDEAALAGLSSYNDNDNIYLLNNYQKNKKNYWYFFSPAYLSTSGVWCSDVCYVSDTIVGFYYNGGSMGFTIRGTGELRPAINVLPNSLIETGGVGTKDNPYVIK